jgi:hypothetical protein
VRTTEYIDRSDPGQVHKIWFGHPPIRVHVNFCAYRQRVEIVNLRSLAHRNAVLSGTWLARAQSGTDCPLRKCKGELGFLTLAMFSGHGSQ